MRRSDERSLLDTVRWLSAFMVGLGHALGLIFAKDGSVASRIIWYFAEMRGGWVMLFFVLSGYLVGGNFLVRLPRFDVWQYAVARFSRIYIVLIPVLLVVLLIDSYAYNTSPVNPVYAPWPNGVLGVIPIFSKYSWRDIIASIVTLESVIGRPIGSAGPLWSLGYEWAFYIAFPLIVLCADWAAKLLGLRPLWTRAAAILLSVVGLVAIHKFFAAAFWLIWIAGALAHVVTKQNLTPIQLHWAGAACALIGLACAPLIDSRVYDPIIGFGFAFFLSAYPSNEKAIFGSIDKKLADFSYSFYAIHLPILTLCLLLLWRWNVVPVGGLPADFHAYGILIAVMMIAILTAFAFGRLFESRTDAFRKILLGARGKQGKA